MSTPPFPSSSEHYRQSHGLQQFFSLLGEKEGMRVLDLGEFTQANVTQITELGHRLFSEDVLHALDSVFGAGDPAELQRDPAKGSEFLNQVLQYPASFFDAVLVWDTLEHLSRPLLDVVIDRLHAILVDQGGMFACFHADSRNEAVQTFGFRIADASTLYLQPRGLRQPAQTYNNRAIEKLFERFSSVKFFLTRDYIREVIVRK